MNPDQITTEWLLSVGCTTYWSPLIFVIARDLNGKGIAFKGASGKWEWYRIVKTGDYKPRFRVKAPSIPNHEVAA